MPHHAHEPGDCERTVAAGRRRAISEMVFEPSPSYSACSQTPWADSRRRQTAIAYLVVTHELQGMKLQPELEGLVNFRMVTLPSVRFVQSRSCGE